MTPVFMIITDIVLSGPPVFKILLQDGFCTRDSESAGDIDALPERVRLALLMNMLASFQRS
jgi:hypothetical protein